MVIKARTPHSSSSKGKPKKKRPTGKSLPTRARKSTRRLGKQGSKPKKLRSKNTKTISFKQFLLGILVVCAIFFEPHSDALSNDSLNSSKKSDSLLEGSSAQARLSASENSNEIDRGEVTPVEDRPRIREQGSSNATTAIGAVGLDSEQMKKVALNIYRVANGITDDFPVADGAATAMYILRYFAEIGEYEIAQKDILKLVETFENLINEKVDGEGLAIINQIRKIKFGRRDGKYFSQFYSVQPARGIVIDINEVSDDPRSSVKEIERFVMEEGSVLYFDEVDTAAEKKRVREFIKNPIKLLGVVQLDSVREALYQVHPDIIEGIDDYLEWEEAPAPVMIVDIEKMYVTVDTSTLFKQIKFEFNKAYTLPGINIDGDAAPSLVLGAKAKLLNLKVSIDQ
jgi:hypothetical protein